MSNKQDKGTVMKFSSLIIIYILCINYFAYSHDTYHGSIINVKILEDISNIYVHEYNNLIFFKAYTGEDTIIVLSKIIDTLLDNNYIHVDSSQTYRIKLKFVPALWDLANNNYQYIRKIDTTILWSCDSDLGLNLASTYSDLYYEQKYFKEKLNGKNSGRYLFYFSPDIISRFIHSSKLIK